MARPKAFDAFFLVATLCLISFAAAVVGITWVQDITRATPQTARAATVITVAENLDRTSPTSLVVKLPNGQPATLSFNGKTAPAEGAQVTYYERTSDGAVSATKFAPGHPYSSLGLIMFGGGMFAFVAIASIAGATQKRREARNPKPQPPVIEGDLLI